MTQQIRTLIVATVVWAGFVHPADAAETFRITLTNGSVLTVETEDQTVHWTNVLSDGTLENKNILLRNVEQLVLSDSPASKQVAAIRGFLQQLGSPDYLQRQSAEAKLSDPDVAGSFQWLVETAREHDKLEVRYRVERILNALEDTEEEAIRDFDVLTATDGQAWQGDAGEFQLKCSYRGKSLTFRRSELQAIRRPIELANVKPDRGAVSVEMFHQHEKHFYQPHQTLIDFEKSPAGDKLIRNTDVSKMFATEGLLLGSESPGFVGISGYGFKFPFPPQGNSVCVFETTPSFSKRFKGVMELRFCQPGQPSIPAGVHEIGLFLARVNHSRDFILEAYNATGQILATVESSDMGCVFAGVKSSEPITFVRILSNPYLFRLSRKIDEDFAVDHICFSEPVPVDKFATSSHDIVRLTNGDVLQAKSLEIDDTQVSFEMLSVGDKFQLAIKDLGQIRFAFDPDKKPSSNEQRHWFTMLPDRSVIKVQPGSNFTSKQFKNLTFQPSEICGLWLGGNMRQARFPVQGDFDNGPHVMVFPTARVVAKNIEFGDAGFSWDVSTKIEQELDLSGEETDEDGEDPTPNLSEIYYEETSVEDIPTLWNRPPEIRAAGTGLIRLDDGQQFVLASPTASNNKNPGLFQVQELNSKSVVIAADGTTATIPFSEIISIEFPE